MTDPAVPERPPVSDYETWRCYRHPERAGSVRCRRCERPVCPDCMIVADVGFQCPECAKRSPGVRTLRSLKRNPYVTYAVIGICVLVFLPSLGGGAAVASRGELDLARELALNAPEVDAGEWWRLVTSGFVHYGLIHIAFNMIVLYQFGSMLETGLGRMRFGALYLAALLGGAVGALLLDPFALTAGASGAVYGLLGATVIGMRRRGVDIMRSGVGTMLLINLAITFVIPGISIGGHLGGLAAGGVAGVILFATEDTPRDRLLGGLAVAALAVVLAAAGLYVAANPNLI